MSKFILNITILLNVISSNKFEYHLSVGAAYAQRRDLQISNLEIKILLGVGCAYVGVMSKFILNITILLNMISCINLEYRLSVGAAYA